jgi:hypothetical protein
MHIMPARSTADVLNDLLVLAVPIAGLLTSVVLAILTGIYVRLTHQLLRAQTDPYVVVYARHDESRPTIIQLVIENIGHGVAENVRFETSGPIPHHAWGIESSNTPRPETMTTGPLISGIVALGPGDTRKLAWGQYGGLHDALGENVIIVTAKFSHRGREMPPVQNRLEVKSFFGTDAVDSDGARRSAKQLERIADAFDAVTRGMRTLPVTVVEVATEPPENV